jgi:hypothetical protein
MSADRVLADLISRDAQRIWAASHDVIRSQDLTLLRALASEGWAIETATHAVELGGALRPNRATLDFALKKLLHVATSDACLCTLYPTYDMFDLAREVQAGHVAILPEVSSPDERVITCSCARCNATYNVEEREYHYPWWQWSARG